MCLKKLELAGVGKSDEEVAGSVSCFSSLMGLEELFSTSSFYYSFSSRDSWICDEHSSALHPSFDSAISHLLSLRSLSLRTYNLTGKGMVSLARILRQFVHLQLIDISLHIHFRLGSAGTKSLCSALTPLSGLHILIFCRCYVEDHGFCSLAFVLKTLPHLVKIDISGICFYAPPIDQGMIALSRELHRCPRL